MTAAATAAALLLVQAPAGKVLTYHDAIRETQANSLDLEVARQRLEQARILGWKLWAGHLPQVSAGASWTHNSVEAVFALPTGYYVRQDPAGNRPPVDPVPAPEGNPTPYFLVPSGFQQATIQREDQLGAQLSATMAILAPQLWYGLAAASWAEKQAEQTVEGVRRDVLFGTAQLYYAAVALQTAVRITEKQLAVARDHERDAKVRFEAGTTPRVALLRAEIDRARAEQDVKATVAGYDSARSALATALGRRDADFEVEVPGEPALPTDVEELSRNAIRERPDVQAAESAIRAAERSGGAVRARYAPTLGAFGRWQWANLGGFTARQDTWAAGLALQWTILDGTLREAELKESGHKVAEAEAAWKGAVLRAEDDVRRARLELDAAVANREKAREQVELARENQRLVEVNYKAGAATYLEVADANNQLLQAELANVSEQVKSRLAALRLLKAAGRFEVR